jgi:hypothetical protein
MHTHKNAYSHVDHHKGTGKIESNMIIFNAHRNRWISWQLLKTGRGGMGEGGMCQEMPFAVGNNSKRQCARAV